jgi:hypothetical protein
LDYRRRRRCTSGGGLAGATPGKSSGARKKTGLAPEERGEGGDLTGGLRTAKVGAGEEIHREVGAPVVSSGGGAVEEWRSSGERCRVERRSCCPFIGRRGKGKGRGQGGGAGSVGAQPLMAAALGARRFRGGEGWEMAEWVATH